MDDMTDMTDEQMYEESAREIIRQAIEDAGYELMHAGMKDDECHDTIRRLFEQELES